MKRPDTLMRTGEDEKIRNSWNLFFFLSWQRGNATAKGRVRPLIMVKRLGLGTSDLKVFKFVSQHILKARGVVSVLN